MAPLFALLVGSAATAGTAATATAPAIAPTAATAGLVGYGGAVTTGGLMTATGTGLAAAGQVQAGRAAAAQAESAQVLAEYNAKVMEQQARAERFKGRFEQVRQAKRGERVKSSLQAALGKAGGLGVGTPLLLEAEQVAELELENLLLGYESELVASRAESQAALDRLQGKIYRQRGKNLATASYIGAGSTLLKGFGGAFR